MINGDEEGSWKAEGRVSSLVQGRQAEEQGGRERRQGQGPRGLGQVLGQLRPLTPVCLRSLAADLAECKLVSFPIGIYKVLRNVTDQIHLITLANNELKSLTSKFMTTFCQLRGRPGQSGQEGVASPRPSGSNPIWGMSPGPVPTRLDPGHHSQGEALRMDLCPLCSLEISKHHSCL